MNQPQGILILDFGGQYTQLIARRVRECGVYSSVLPYAADMEAIRQEHPLGIILSGGPASVLDSNAPTICPGVFDGKCETVNSGEVSVRGMYGYV